MANFGKERRKARLAEIFSVTELIDEKMYNIILCGTVLYGIIVNFILCVTVGNAAKYMDPFVFLILYFVLCFGGIWLSAKSKNPAVSFLGYNMIVIPIGLAISTCVELMSKAYGSEVVVEAFLITMCVTLAMTAFAIFFPDKCASFGYLLLPCLIGLLIAEIVMLILGISNIAFAWIGAILFSLYIAYDVYRSQQKIDHSLL